MHPSEGALTLPDTAFQFDGASLPIREMPPTLGQHGSEILAGIGYTAADIERFIDQGVTIAPSTPAAVEA
jgi:crotonobetainyl-CoA:carnitine CoA-transferase CaiB-like acyl-CoA transferase